MTSALAGSGNDGLHVDIVSVALADQPAGWMGNDRDMAIVHRANDALGLSLAGEIELIMHSSHDQIEPGQDLVRQIKAAIGEDVDFSPLEHGEAIELVAQFVDFVDLTPQPRR